MILSLRNIHARSPKGVEVLKGVSVEFDEGKIYAIMGPNGSGKSTLASVVAGHPGFTVTQGRMTLRNLRARPESVSQESSASQRAGGGEVEVTSLSPEERARAGLFLAFQYPVSIPGVTIGSLLKQSIRAVQGDHLRPQEVRRRIDAALAALSLGQTFLDRYVNDNLSGGEKKKSEILQLLCLNPSVAILDETDSGLDVDALRVVSNGIQEARRLNPSLTVVVITHYQRILQYLEPDVVHILWDGRIVRTGGKELAEDVEKNGYSGMENEGGRSESQE